MFEGHGHVFFCLHLTTIFLTIQQSVFSNTDWSVLRHEVQCF